MRRPDAAQRITELAMDYQRAKNSGAGLVWGLRDPYLFVADHVLAVTGADPAAAWRGSYDSAEGAAAMAAKYYGGGVEAFAAAMAAEFGFEEIPPTWPDGINTCPLAVGDLGLCRQSGMEDRLGVFYGSTFLFLAQAGKQYFDPPSAARVWKIV